MKRTKIYTHDRDTHNLNAARLILPVVFEYINPRNVVDYGCGLGSWLKVAKDLIGADILGIDGSHVDTSLMYIEKQDYLVANLEEPLSLPDKYDLAICLEVAEHISESHEDKFFHSLIALSNTILFSAAVPGQGGQNHINEKWQKYWANKFEHHGYNTYSILDSTLLAHDDIEWWYRQNIMMCTKDQSVIEKCMTLGKVENRVAIENYIQKLEYINYLSNGNISVKLLERAILKRIGNMFKCNSASI